MQPLTEWAAAHYPRKINAQPPPDYIKIAYLLAVVSELEQRLAALEQPPVLAPSAAEIVWPKSPLRCHCENFEEDPDDLFSCLHCGGVGSRC